MQLVRAEVWGSLLPFQEGAEKEQLDVKVWDEEAREPGSSSEGGLAPGPGGWGT